MGVNNRMSKLVNKNKIFSPEDKRDYNLDTVGIGLIELPEEFIPEKRIPITNQFWSSMCVSHALSTTMSYCELKQGLEPNEYSKGFIYGNRNGYNETMEGMFTRDAIKILHKEGDCPHQYFRWHMSSVETVVKAFKKKEIPLQEQALPHRIKSYVRLYGVEEIKQAVYQYGACVLCYPTRKSNKTYIEPATDKQTGYHGIKVIGWRKDNFILKNSWGKLAGDHGLFYMNFNYDWREAWLLILRDDVPRKPAPKGDWFFDICNNIKEFIIGLWDWLGIGIKNYAVPWFKKLFKRER